MTLQDLLKNTNIDLKRTKIVRHNLSNPIVRKCYSLGYIELYQALQGKERFKNCDTILSFIGEEGTNAVYYGCYKVDGQEPMDFEKLPEELKEDWTNGGFYYNLTRVDFLPDMVGRLVVDWGKGAINWCLNGTTEKEVIEVRRVASEIDFPGYDNIIISWEELNSIVSNQEVYSVWRDKLTAVAGVYLITDRKTGKQYVGSASGEEGGIWGRWCNYAKKKHGGNKLLKEVIAADPEYCKNFQYSILEVLPLKKDKHEVWKCESLYKNKLMSREYGYNDN